MPDADDTDIFSPEKRSEIMSLVRHESSKPEVRVRKLLHRAGYRFRLHNKKLPGTPDIVLPKYKTVVFVHGCFWHHHEGCKRAALPKKNREFWAAKFERNMQRDKRVRHELKELGWRVIVVWECELAKKNEHILCEKLDSIRTKGQTE